MEILEIERCDEAKSVITSKNVTLTVSQGPGFITCSYKDRGRDVLHTALQCGNINNIEYFKIYGCLHISEDFNGNLI